MFSPFRVLIDIEVAPPPIFNFFKRSSLSKVRWLQLWSIKKVFTFLMEFLCFIVTRATHILTILVCWLMEALLKSSISVHLFDNSKFPHYELPQSSPTMSCQVDERGQGFSFLKFGQRWGSWKNCSEIGH